MALFLRKFVAIKIKSNYVNRDSLIISASFSIFGASTKCKKRLISEELCSRVDSYNLKETNFVYRCRFIVSNLIHLFGNDTFSLADTDT